MKAKMDEPEHDDKPLELTYTGVFVRARDHIIVPAVVDTYAEERRDHALVQHWRRDDWVQQLIDESLCGVCAAGTNPVEIFNVGVGGHVVLFRLPGGVAEEDVDLSPRGPNYSETLRCARLVAGVLHVAGTARQVYRRNPDGAWTAIDAGVYQPRGSRGRSTGFLDIDGFGPSELYAAGYKGELWSFDGGTWVQLDSPTKATLTKVHASSASEVYVAGLAGTLICGRGDRWTLLAEGQVSDDLWGLAEFNGSIYVASNRAVYRVENRTLVEVDFGQDHPVTTAYLHAADGILVSVGPKDILRTEDGVHWSAMPKP